MRPVLAVILVLGPMLCLTATSCKPSGDAPDSASETGYLAPGATAGVDARGDSVWVSAEGDTAYATAPDDPDVLRSRQDAQCALDEFRRRLASPPRSQSQLAYKIALRDSVETEHVWLEPIASVGDSAVRGVIKNDVIAVRGYAAGDSVVAPLDSIEDWLAIDRDTVLGAFSVRVHRDRLTRDERARYDSATGYLFRPDSVNWRDLVAGCRGRRGAR